jgi:hypothetical protein
MEGGVAWALLALERFERAHETHIQWNPRGQLSPRWDEKVGDYIRKHVAAGRLFVGCEGDELGLALACKAIGAEAFVFSSDFPHEVNNNICKQEIHEIEEHEELSDDAKAAILHRNAERFYGLSSAKSEVGAAATAAS